MQLGARAVCLSLIAGLALGCGESETAREIRADPEAAFQRLEEDMLAAPALRISYSITAQGAYDASLSGVLLMAAGNRIRLEASGSFAGEPVDAVLVSNGTGLSMIVGGEETLLETPGQLNEAVVVGLTRMGLLHNLARLTEGAPPDHGAGAAAKWVKASGFSVADAPEDPPVDGVPVEFGIVLSQEPVGEVTMWLDPRTGLPMLRTQTVHFPEGDMLVTEAYHEVDLEAEPTAAAFTLN